MFGEYSVIKDNKVMLKQRNNITPEGRKQILNMLSHNNKEVGYKKINHKGNISIEEITDDNYITLLPEYYLRPYSPHYIDEKEFMDELKNIDKEIIKFYEVLKDEKYDFWVSYKRNFG